MLSSTITWSLEQRSVKSLLENSKNPRKMTKDQAEHLKSSVEKFGFCEPIVINLDGSIIGGHMRLKTVKTLGYKDIDVYVPSRLLTEDESDELTIRLNKNVGEWDFDILANSWDPKELTNWGFDYAELGIVTDEKSSTPGKNPKLTITFDNVEQLQHAENRISVIVDEYQGASYKKSIK